ncbi:DUF3298 domain-containing protein [bacterium BFN5]|nr:DUF3298 domain-containing protein [bacterium BFN5]QJW44753.1 DUF3298 domain-containing protein [bacterium BFN5]
MKKIVLLIVVIFVAVAAGGTWYHVKNVKNKPIYANVLPQEEKITDNNLLWPKIQELPNVDVQKNLNNVLQQEFIRLSDEAAQMQKVSVRADYLVQFNTQNILSLTITESLYPERAAHPMHNLKAFTMNVQTGKIYQFQDLFKSGSAYQARVNEIIQKQVNTKEIVFIAPYTGIKENEQGFYLTAKDVVVFYQPYEYTPYVYGFLKFTIPFEQIADIINPEIGKAILAAQLHLKK